MTTLHRILALGIIAGLLACLPACARGAEPTPVDSEQAGAASSPLKTASASDPDDTDTQGSDGPSPRDLESWHAKTYVSTGSGLRVIYYWSRRDWMRAETVINGHPIVTIVRGADYLAFDRLTRRGIRIERSPDAIAADARRERPFGNDLEELIAQGAVLIEETTQSGRPVEIWRITDGEGRRKLWVSRDEPRLPIRVENFWRASSDLITTNYVDWTAGLELPDVFFEAPPDMQIETFDYSSFLEASGTRSIGPVLYPDLLHGSPAR